MQMLQSDWLGDSTLSAISVKWLQNGDVCLIKTRTCSLIANIVLFLGEVQVWQLTVDFK